MEALPIHMTHTRQPVIVIASLVILVAPALALRYRQYAYAVAWHCRHGNFATFPGHRIRLPLFWWEEKDSLHWETYELKRAVPSFYWLELNEIEVRHVIPALQTTIVDTDQEELDQLNKLIAAFNDRRKPKHPETLAFIRTKGMALYCLRLEPSETQSSNGLLDCMAPKFPYTISSGPFTREEEAKAILSTLE